ncbi:MAG: cysteine desulfurase / selenocysteine lyase [Elusimicrobia bacterium]|nr:MAG: cysteine desulfurase / selenocysteine lyase [Elusimicrobiota bacterium]
MSRDPRDSHFGLGRSEFPRLRRPLAGGRRLVYLDSACTALKLRGPADRMREFYLEDGGCGGGRALYELSRRAEGAAAEAREAAAGFLGAATPEEVVFTSGATAALNLVAGAFPLPRGRGEILLTDLEHNSAYLPFYERARRDRLRLRVLPTQGGRLDPAVLRRALSKRTGLVVLPHASNVYGGVLPLKEAVGLAHDAGALVLADDAQYVQSHRSDVQESGVDFALFSAHKLGGPFGVGVLYGKAHLLNRMSGLPAGGGTVSALRRSRHGWEPDYLDAPKRLEPGIADYAGLAGLTETLRLYARLDYPALRAHIAALVRRAARGLNSLPGVRVLGSEDHLAEGSLVSFHVAGRAFSAPDLALYLDSGLARHSVAVRAGTHCAHILHGRLGLQETVRLSFFAYSREEDVDVFLAALRGYLARGRAAPRRQLA